MNKSIWEIALENAQAEERALRQKELADAQNRKAVKKALKKIGHSRTTATQEHFRQKRLAEMKAKRLKGLEQSLPTAENFGAILNDQSEPV